MFPKQHRIFQQYCNIPAILQECYNIAAILLEYSVLLGLMIYLIKSARKDHYFLSFSTILSNVTSPQVRRRCHTRNAFRQTFLHIFLPNLNSYSSCVNLKQEVNKNRASWIESAITIRRLVELVVIVKLA